MPNDARQIAAMSRRILRAWHAASASDLASGLAWYERAHEHAQALAVGNYLSARQCAGIIAALSPRVDWQTNLRAASAIVEAATGGQSEPIVAGLPANRAKAWRIACGDDPNDILGGSKVRAFFANITGDANAVTVDVWAARLAEGRENPRAPSGGRYARIATAYKRAASAVGVTPRDMQAATWVHVRGAASGTFKPSLARAGYKAGRV